MAKKKNTFSFDNQKDHGAAFFGNEAGPSSTPIPFAHAVSRTGGVSNIGGSVDTGRGAIRAAATPYPVLVAPFSTPASPGQASAGKSLNPINPPARATTVAAGTRAAVNQPAAGPGAVTRSNLPVAPATPPFAVNPNLGINNGIQQAMADEAAASQQIRNRRPGRQVD